MEAIIILLLIGLVLLAFIYVNKKRKQNKLKNAQTKNNTYENAMYFIETFKTASKGIDSLEELKAFERQHMEKIGEYFAISDFKIAYNNIYDKIIDKIS